MTRTFDCYCAGRFNNTGPYLIMFRFYRADGTFGSCQLVEEKDAAAEREALIRMGWSPRSV